MTEPRDSGSANNPFDPDLAVPQETVAEPATEVVAGQVGEVAEPATQVVADNDATWVGPGQPETLVQPPAPPPAATTAEALAAAPPPVAPPPPTWPAAATAAVPVGMKPQVSNRAIAVIALAISSFILCPVLPAIVALFMAPGANREIDASNGWLTGRGLVTGGKVLSWVNIALTVGVAFIVIAVLAIGVTM